MDTDLALRSPDDLGQAAGARARIDQDDPPREPRVTIGEANSSAVLASLVKAASTHDEAIAEIDGIAVLKPGKRVWPSGTWIGE